MIIETPYHKIIFSLETFLVQRTVLKVALGPIVDHVKDTRAIATPLASSLVILRGTPFLVDSKKHPDLRSRISNPGRFRISHRGICL